MTQTHIRYMTYVMMTMKLHEFKDAKLRGHFVNLSVLMALRFIREFADVGFDGGYFKAGDSALINEANKIMLSKLRPQAIPLIELYPMPDEIICSSIGNSYGDIYETQFEWAKNSRMNDPANGSIPKGFNEHILPILHGKL